MTITETWGELKDGIEAAKHSYHRLVLLVGPSGSGKTELLQRLTKQQGSRMLNVNLELSQQMLELPKRKWARQAAPLLKNLVSKAGGDLLILDNLEVLFDSALQLDPLRLLKSASRNQTIVASWNGLYQESVLTYAEADHPEHRSCRDVDAVVISTEK